MAKENFASCFVPDRSAAVSALRKLQKALMFREGGNKKKEARTSMSAARLSIG